VNSRCGGAPQPVRASSRIAAERSRRAGEPYHPVTVRSSPLPLALSLAVALSACRSVPTVPPDVRNASQAPRDDRAPRVALVLGGGAARGFAHVGVLRVLEEAGIPVELVVGTSVGALVGALYADGHDARALEHLARDLDRDDFFDFGLAPALFGTGLAKGERLEAWMTDHLRTLRIEQLELPFAAVATDLGDGSVVVLDRGEVARAVRASSAIPGVFEPVELGGRLLVDGGVVANLPVKAARDLGADVIVAVDVTEVSGPGPREGAGDPEGGGGLAGGGGDGQVGRGDRSPGRAPGVRGGAPATRTGACAHDSRRSPSVSRSSAAPATPPPARTSSRPSRSRRAPRPSRPRRRSR
jgi:NTE family protein